MDFTFLVGIPFRGAFQLSLAVLFHYRLRTELFSLGSTARPLFSQHSQAGLLVGESRLDVVIAPVAVVPWVLIFRGRDRRGRVSRPSHLL